MAGRAIGIVYETFGAYPRRVGDPDDYEAEFEPEATVEGLEAALRSLGAEPVRLGTPRQLLDAIGSGRLPPLDAALSIAEGHGSRNRESWAPCLLEMAGVPAVGSDALTLALSLDKVWTNRIVAGAGIAVAPQCELADAAEALKAPLPAAFPLFVKPRWEGTAKGIRSTSRVEDRESLACEVGRIVSQYRQPALVERFLGGPEYTVTVVGNDPPRCLPALQRALDRETGIGLHAVEGAASDPGSPARTHHTPGELSPDLERSLRTLALRAFETLECLDFARIDFRLDEAGEPHFLEINPLPTFAPDGSFGILAELEGRALSDLLADVLGAALARLQIDEPRIDGPRIGEEGR